RRDAPGAGRDKPPTDELRDPFGDPPAGRNSNPPGGSASEDAKKADTLAKLGEQSLKANDIGGAASNFKKALDLDPRNADAIMGQGEIAMRAGSYGVAIGHLKKAARLRPRSAKVHVLLGEAYLNAGNTSQAAS